ncbi:hypothetical protein GCM10025868_09430 [Angustibacter aerolatus]|uniref:HTH tetR-type domain-containing protein n=1 Tax=Angustibacter aerolatus TaxID=1162965 RepID=A0ABQ6JC03_9ACTN|nr:helix-turn-helix domain-containing protein [Angustibacter aerolatus]GMA85693.1 hypothetical protein GCM10025868_09430 [Angustibacter aerolatus]
MGRPRQFDEDGVLRTAREQFWATGYAGTSMETIAAATGLGKGSLYGAFGGKREPVPPGVRRLLHGGRGVGGRAGSAATTTRPCRG